MTQAQSGILPEANRHAVFITMTIDNNNDTVRRVSAAIPELTQQVVAMDSTAALASVIAFSSNAWDQLFPAQRPAQLRPFQEFRDIGNDIGRVAPSTQEHADLFLHIRSDRHDLNFELARIILNAFGDSVSVTEEVHCFRYLDSRDLIGFVDGTENPQGDDRAEVALVDQEDPEFAGGSYISIQRYVTNLKAWEQVSLADQEQIIARTKADNIEFSNEDKPLTSHLKRVSIKEDGKSLEILRHSMPYGQAGSDHGLYFVAYCATPDNFDKMLQQMIVADEDGSFDHLLQYTQATTGASFFAPSLDFLAATAA